jgi:hypothetical protein
MTRCSNCSNNRPTQRKKTIKEYDDECGCACVATHTFSKERTTHYLNLNNNNNNKQVFLTNSQCCCHAGCPHAINVYRSNGKVDKISGWDHTPPPIVQWNIWRGRGCLFGKCADAEQTFISICWIVFYHEQMLRMWPLML